MFRFTIQNMRTPGSAIKLNKRSGLVSKILLKVWAERSLSSKLKLYNLAKASCMEALEDFEDILHLEHLPRWDKNDRRLHVLRRLKPNLSYPSTLQTLGTTGGLEGLVNYQIDLLVRCGYLLDQQIRAVEQQHEREGGYRENLLKKRLQYKRFANEL